MLNCHNFYYFLYYILFLMINLLKISNLIIRASILITIIFIIYNSSFNLFNVYTIDIVIHIMNQIDL